MAKQSRRNVIWLAGAAAVLGLARPVLAEATMLEAARNGDAARVRAAIAAKEDLEVRDAEGRTPLLLATRANHVEVARLLIEAGADVNAKDAIKDTPYLYAAAEGRSDILKLCLAHGANLKDTNRYGGVGLIPAADRGHVENVRILLATDIDVNHVNNLGWTALMEAVILGDGGAAHQEIVRLLLDAGADRSIADKDGVTPLQHARRLGFAEMVAMLE